MSRSQPYCYVSEIGRVWSGLIGAGFVFFWTSWIQICNLFLRIRILQSIGKKWRKTLISTRVLFSNFFKIYPEVLSLKNDEIVPSKKNKHKNLASWRYLTNEKNRIRIRQSKVRIRGSGIRTKMSRSRNTAFLRAFALCYPVSTSTIPRFADPDPYPDSRGSGLDPDSIGSVDPDSESGTGSGSRRAKMTHKSRTFFKKFMFWSVGWPLLRAEGFFCNLDALYGGLGIGKL